MTIINRDSFQPTETPQTKSWGTETVGTVECTLGGETRRVSCVKTTWTETLADLKGITFRVYGAFSGRYRTGKTAWPATIELEKRGEFIRFGRDDRDPKFNKANYLFWR